MDVDAPISVQISAAYGPPAPLDMYPLTSGTNNQSYRVESAAGQFFLKHYLTSQDSASLRYEHRLLSLLAARPLSFAVPMPLSTGDAETLLHLDGELYTLFTWLPGEAPEPTVVQAEAYGRALGELHAALASFPTEPRPGMGSYGALDQVHPRLPHPARLDLPTLGLVSSSEAETALAWWQHEIHTLQAFIAGPYRQLPWQVIHGDVGFVNSLFIGERLAALLDFEFAVPDVRAIDLASALRSLLRRHDLPSATTLAQALLRGYRRQVVLDEAEISALPLVIRLSSAVSTLWWLGRHLAAGDTAAAAERLLHAWQFAQVIAQQRARIQAWAVQAS